jgi:hypothetical protein
MTSAMSTRPARRWGLYLPFLLLGLVALGWSGLWLYTQNRVGGELAAFLERERERGRAWACPDQQIAGYPFRIEISCRQPSYSQTRPDGQQVVGSLGGLRTVARAYDPQHIIVDLDGPLTARDAAGSVTDMRWRTARMSVKVRPGRLERFSLDTAEPVIEVKPRGFEAVTVSAERLEAHLRPAIGGSGGNVTGAYDIAFSGQKTRIALLDALLRSSEPVDLALDATATRMTTLNPRDWRATLDGWRQQGGTLEVRALRLAKGAARLQATGTLQLDEERRPAGRLEAELVNAGDILRQFGIGGPTVGLLGAVLGGGERNRKGAGGPSEDRTLRLPITIAGGVIRVGPVPIGRVQPLY